MTHANLLSRPLEIGTPSALSAGQLALDSTLHHFSEEASNPIAIASMTLGSLAFQASRAGLLSLGISRNYIFRNVISYAGALAGEVTVFRSVNHILNAPLTPTLSPEERVFGKEWFSTALDLGLLKFVGSATSTQNIFLRHVNQDLAMVMGHELGARWGWIPAQSGNFIEKLFQAETLNWQMIAGTALGHTLSRGRLQMLERSLATRSEILAQNFTRFEPRWDAPLPSMATDSDSALTPAHTRLYLEARPGEAPRNWAERLFEFTAQKPEENALHVIARLYTRIQNPATREHALESIRHLEELSHHTVDGENLLVRHYSVEGLEKPILLVSLPSTFLPEAWSHTFVQGMALDHLAHPQERKLAIEVGSGTGYVSIAMSKLGMAERMIATDKNPHAPLMGRLNAAINDVENIEFQNGDLLAGIPEGISADLIVGCLPQMPSAKANGEISLRGLADYAENRGVFEDQLGLGLNATVIDQARTRLSPHGKLRLMMAQRPGLHVVHDLFATRGFATQALYSTRILQDPTTNFSALAGIEAEHGFLFEFRNAAGERISANQALVLDRREIFHDLHVVEASPYSQLFQKSSEAVAETFLRAAYTEDPGSEHPRLHEQVRQYLQSNWGIDMDPATLFLAPSCAAILEGILRLTLRNQEKIGIVGEIDSPSQRMLAEYPEVRIERLGNNLEGLLDSLQGHPPQALLFKLSRQILKDSEHLEALLRLAIRENMLLIFLEEQGALLNSEGRVLLRTLSRYPQALAQSVIIHSMESLFHTSAFPLAAALLPHPAFYERLRHYGEVTYSRASSATQAVYSAFFSQPEMQDTLLERIPREGVIRPRFWKDFPLNVLSQQMTASTTFHSSPLTSHPDPIAMDFGESEWRAPISWREILREASDTPPAELYRRTHLATLRYLEETRQASFTDHEIVLGAGVQPLIVAAIRGIQKLHPGKRVVVLVPTPSYGIFFPTIEAAGATLQRIPTRSAEAFLLTPQAYLASPKEADTIRVTLINTPSNPGGQYYPARYLERLLRASEAQGDYLWVDEVFGLLALSEIERLNSLSSARNLPKNRLVIFGGTSKEFALGGIRFGFAASENMALIQAMQSQSVVVPDPLALATASNVLPSWRFFVREHVRYLTPQVYFLETFFTRRGFPVHRVQGGLSLFVDFSRLFASPHFIEGERLSSENFHDLLLKHAGIQIKSDQWAGVPGHYRFVFSIERGSEAIERLDAFFAKINP